MWVCIWGVRICLCVLCSLHSMLQHACILRPFLCLYTGIVICIYVILCVCVCARRLSIEQVLWNASPSNHQIRNAVWECSIRVWAAAASNAVFSDWVMWYSIFQRIYDHPGLTLIMETVEIWPYCTFGLLMNKTLHFFSFSLFIFQIRFSHCSNYTPALTCVWRAYSMLLRQSFHHALCLSTWTQWLEDIVFVKGWIHPLLQPSNILYPNAVFNR